MWLWFTEPKAGKPRWVGVQRESGCCYGSEAWNTGYPHLRAVAKWPLAPARDVKSLMCALCVHSEAELHQMSPHTHHGWATQLEQEKAKCSTWDQEGTFLLKHCFNSFGWWLISFTHRQGEKLGVQFIVTEQVVRINLELKIINWQLACLGAK